jgi:ferredoxin
MTYKIVASKCTACGACEDECPNSAISLKNEVYVIDQTKCQECKGRFNRPQCAAVCPVPRTCIPA